ncbi:MAG: hypothetical protein V1799_16525 [bacterium]
MRTILLSEYSLIISKFLDWFRLKRRHLVVRFLLWGVGILFLAQLLASLVSNSGKAEIIPNYVPWEDPPLVRSRVVTLPLMASNSPETYLPHCITLVDQLKAAGAKLVVVDYRGIHPDVNGPVFDYTKRLMETGIVIFAVEPQWRGLESNFPLAEFSIDADVARYGRIHRFTPTGAGNHGDVLIELLRRAHQYPDSMRVTIKKEFFAFGDYAFPCDSEGSFYMDLNNLRITSDAELNPVRVIEKPTTHELDYYSSGNWYTPDTTRSPLLNKYAKRYKDKFVLLLNENFPERPYPYFLSSCYPLAFASLQQGMQPFVQSKWLHYGFAILFMLLIGVVCYRLRLSFAIPFVLILTLGSFYAIDWLLYRQHIFVQMLPLTFSIVLTTIVFPLLKFAFDHSVQKQASTNTNVDSITQ